jgi:hypothetical protein
MRNLAHTASRHTAPICRPAVIENPRFRSGQGIRMPVSGLAWMPPRSVVHAVAFTSGRQVPTTVQNQGVLIDVCPGHRTWRPPV